MRKPLQGVRNVVAFNWPYFAFSALAVSLFFAVAFLLPDFRSFFIVGAFGITAANTVSLLVTLYVYDLSGLYELRWLEGLHPVTGKVLSVSAGFDETSDIIRSRFPGLVLFTCDFFDPSTHTEPSIARARETYPQKPDLLIETRSLPFEDSTFSFTFLIMSAHEIRDRQERTALFAEIGRVTNKIVLVEHPRDLWNFLGYSFGAFHFLPRHEWVSSFRSAGLTLEREMKINPFVTCFFLNSNGTGN